jgi:hypothetical protein
VLTATTTKEKLRPDFMEPHYTLGELATHWHMSVRSLRDWFVDEPGVIKFGLPKLTKGKRRTYISIRVPESVAWRVYTKMTGREIHRPLADCRQPSAK